MFIENQEFFLPEEFRRFQTAGGRRLRKSDVFGFSRVQSTGEDVSEYGSKFFHAAVGTGIRERGGDGQVGFVLSIAVQVRKSEEMRKYGTARIFKMPLLFELPFPPKASFRQKNPRNIENAFLSGSFRPQIERTGTVGHGSEYRSADIAEGAIPETEFGTFGNGNR